MHVLKQGDANFTLDELSFLEVVGGDAFPWYISMATEHFPGLSHTVMKRSEEQSEGIPWSPFFDQTKKMFLRLCADNGISVRTIYRMSFNLTLSDPSKHGDPHVDHKFPHNNLIIYLNKFDEGHTFILDDENNVLETITPAMDKFAVFDGQRHAQGFCRPQQTRMIFIGTFDGDVTPGGNP